MTGTAKIRQAVELIRKTRPVYAPPLMTMERVRDDKTCNTLATDGIKLFYNEEFCQQTPLKDLQFILMHEVLHKWMGHPRRLLTTNKAKRGKANVAADLAVNSMLIQQGESLPTSIKLYCPGDSPYKDLPHGKSFEWYLNEMPDDDTNESDDVTPSAGEGEVNTLKEMNSAIQSAKNKSIGKHSATFMEKVLSDMLQPPKVPWQQVIKQYVSVAASNRKRTFSREARRDSEFILPSHRKEKKLAKTCIVMDTSGSMDDLTLHCISEIFGLMQCCSGVELEVVMVDTEVRNVIPITTERDIEAVKNNVRGGGGTEMGSGFTYAVEHGAKLIICISDMYLDEPPRPPVPVIWCQVGNGYCTPTYGETVKVEE